MIVVRAKFFATAMLFFLLTWPLSSLFSTIPAYEGYDNKRVCAITVLLENPSRETTFNQKYVLKKLSIKVGDPFSQLTFDDDLKTLSQEYDRIEPIIEIHQEDVAVTIKLWQRPLIRNISYSGNKKVKTHTLQKELNIMAYTIFNREKFNTAFNKLKEYYIKKGYFNSQLEYQVTPYPNINEVDIEIIIREGQSGRIRGISFSGLNQEDEKRILTMINTKRYNLFTSWLTGTGTYYEEALEYDQLIITNYLQNQGYADARVNVQVKESRDGHIKIYINAIKGELFHFGSIAISGNTLFSTEKLKKIASIREGAIFSPEELLKTIEEIRKLYGKDGYIDTDLQYTIHLEQHAPIYTVNIIINEGKQFHIGIIHVLGNVSTNTNVILRESLLIPGSIFDSRKLEATQKRLESMGYFKSVNVYAVKPKEDQQIDENYRDVIIEVSETTTGSFSFFAGISRIDDIYFGIEFTENNFDHRGLTQWWRKGLSSFRGAGEYVQVRTQFGKKQTSYTMSWVDPYFKDSLWRFGFDLNYSKNCLQSNDYHMTSHGGSLFTSYPLTAYWTYGWKTNLRNAFIKINNIQNQEAIREENNNALIGSIGHFLTFNSTDNAFKPRHGLCSTMEIELGEIKRHSQEKTMFPYFQLRYVNSCYYPIWEKGTLKLQEELKCIYPLPPGKPELLPLSERFFLGGETTVRGYKPYSIGPKFMTKDGKQGDDPMGGTTSVLFSIEYMYQLLPMLELFVFFDAGSIALKPFTIDRFRTSLGIGVRVNLKNNIPITIGYGFPINPGKHEKQSFFYSMGGEF